MNTALYEIDKRTNLTANNKFELLLFDWAKPPVAVTESYLALMFPKYVNPGHASHYRNSQCSRQ